MKFIDTFGRNIKQIPDFLANMRTKPQKSARHHLKQETRRRPKPKRQYRYDKTVDFTSLRKQKIFSFSGIDGIFKCWLVFSIVMGIYLFSIDKVGFILSVAELMLGFGIFNAFTQKYENRYSYIIISVGGIAAGILRYIPMQTTPSKKALLLLWILYFTIVALAIFNAYKDIIATSGKIRRCHTQATATVVEVRQRLCYDEHRFFKMSYTPVLKYTVNGTTYLNDYYVCKPTYKLVPHLNCTVNLYVNKADPDDILIKGYLNKPSMLRFARRLTLGATVLSVILLIIAKIAS
ncbi:MAG: hypothetical protein MJ089_02815 [Ruminococcus sp.]|nr:hypothetical protein [Ruminococcus sp.]